MSQKLGRYRGHARDSPKTGYQVGEDLSSADYIVINTCGFLQESREEGLSVIEEALQERKECAKVIVTGCIVQTHSGLIREHHPKVDCFLGSGDVEGFFELSNLRNRGLKSRRPKAI